jgi:Zn-dependent protease
VLSVFDAELLAAGFRHLGFAHHSTLITHFEAPQTLSVFVNETLPAYAYVRRSQVPEDGRCAVLELLTELSDGTVLESMTSSEANGRALPATLRLQVFPGVAVSEVVRRHAERVTTECPGAQARAGSTLEESLALVAGQMRILRETWRQRGWIEPTPDPQLDRFTLRGAFGLARYSQRVARGVTMTAPQSPVAAPTADARALRLEAELDAVLAVAETPQRPPGTPWPLLTLIAATALASFVAMSLLWDPLIAAIILGVIAFHEAGHAIAMRLIGYRDVHVFFVPLLGAMTIGSTANATVRGQIAMLLAGPVPGLWLAVAVLAIDQVIGPEPLLRGAGVGLLLINALNLLPLTPFDGGRVMELLSRPESAWRLVIHVASIFGLLALALALEDSIIILLAIFWAALLPQQWLGYRLRSSVAAAVTDAADHRDVVRAALDVMATPRYSKWRSLARQVHARMLAKQFAQPRATSSDRAWGLIAYLTSWVPLAIAAALWR